MAPGRIVLSRRAGFDLQAQSHALNGLPALSVARPGRWGNAFAIAEVAQELGLPAEQAQAVAVERFEQWITGRIAGPKAPPSRDQIRTALGGKNLACWCRTGSPCHADVLLRYANE